jgi:hypothetical protein
MEKSIVPQGWIKLHRKLIEKGFYKKSEFVHLWIHLLFKANHKKKEFMWNDEIIIIKEGQLLTGREKLSEQTGISESKIERILNYFEKERQIEQQKTTKFRVITIVNWTTHQISEQQPNNNRTTTEQQLDTNKNDNNEKNEKTTSYIDGNNLEQCIYREWNRKLGHIELTTLISLGVKHGWEELFGAIEQSVLYNAKNVKYVKAILEPSQTKSGEEKRSENAMQAYLKKKQAEGK